MPGNPGDQVTNCQRRLKIYLLTIILALGWIVLICLPPWLMAVGQFTLAQIGYQSFSIICHQIPERSWEIAGFPLAVCSRCTAIYVGGLAGLLLHPLTRLQRGWLQPAGLSKGWLALALLPMLADVAFDLLGLRPNTFLTRTITGGLAGIALALYLTPTILAAGAEWRRGSAPYQTGDNRHE